MTKRTVTSRACTTLDDPEGHALHDPCPSTCSLALQRKLAVEMQPHCSLRYMSKLAGRSLFHQRAKGTSAYIGQKFHSFVKRPAAATAPLWTRYTEVLCAGTSSSRGVHQHVVRQVFGPCKAWRPTKVRHTHGYEAFPGTKLPQIHSFLCLIQQPRP